VWPAPGRLEACADLVFYLIGQQNHDLHVLGFEAPHSALIGIVDPTKVWSAQSFLDTNPHAALVKPFDTAAILTSIFVARNNFGLSTATAAQNFETGGNTSSDADG
jgi:AmiR/NasT family two-component response regulator